MRIAKKSISYQKLVLDDLLMLPAKGFMGIIQKIHEMVERELSDETYIREKLMDLDMRFESGEIDEEALIDQERALLSRLEKEEE